MAKGPIYGALPRICVFSCILQQLLLTKPPFTSHFLWLFFVLPRDSFLSQISLKYLYHKASQNNFIQGLEGNSGSIPQWLQFTMDSQTPLFWKVHGTFPFPGRCAWPLLCLTGQAPKPLPLSFSFNFSSLFLFQSSLLRSSFLGNQRTSIFFPLLFTAVSVLFVSHPCLPETRPI